MRSPCSVAAVSGGHTGTVNRLEAAGSGKQRERHGQLRAAHGPS